MAQMNPFPRQEPRRRHRERTCGHAEKGEGLARRLDTLTRVKYKASIAATEKLLCSAGSSAPCSVVTERWRNKGVQGEGDPRGKGYMCAYS